MSNEERAFLLAHDTDAFNKWESGRALAKDVMARMITEGAPVSPEWLDALARVAQDVSLDPAFRALCLRLPSEDDMAQTLAVSGQVPDPQAIYRARRDMALGLAQKLAPVLADLIAANSVQGAYSPAAADAGKRSLKLACLQLQSRLDGAAMAAEIYAKADNMTEVMGALQALLENGKGEAELAAFGQKWADDRNVMDKWFMVQIALAAPERAAGVTQALTKHADFDYKNPNRFRAVIGALSANHAGFHHASGAGYRLVADWLLVMDGLNPQTAARMSTAFETWPRYDADRQALMKAELQRILAHPALSRDLSEMAGRMYSA